jgi:hypothetical protein
MYEKNLSRLVSGSSCDRDEGDVHREGEGEEHGGEDGQVARLRSSERVLLEERETTGASGEEVEELHNDETVDRRSVT